MRVVRKVSRRRRKMSLYEYERIFVPIPVDEQATVQPWVGRDLKIFVRPVEEGFAILAVTEDKYVEGRPLSQIFEDLVMKEPNLKPAEDP